MIVREFSVADEDQVWALLKPVIRAGDTYALPRDLGRRAALDYWTGTGKKAFVVEDAGDLLGTYNIKANQQGGGSHVCNCGYVTGEKARGRGVASLMCQHSLDVARERGFRAMQYNFVVSTNDGAVRLWKKLGFDIVGTLPKAFRHPKFGDVDAFVMYQLL